MEVRVLPPDPTWTEMYKAEAQRISATLKELDAEVHHIGSTAIYGIFAKPIIDILLVVNDLNSLDAQVQAMCTLGYEVMGEFGIPARRYFRKSSQNGVRTYQIHAFEWNSSGTKRHLAFRDYMNAHPQAAEAYSLLKQRLATEFPFDIQAYMNGKDAFIKQHESIALAWALSNQNRE